jgi:hypothetical protein
MADQAQPTILVKKKDGTTVRMTMAEFGIYQKTGKSEGKKQESNHKSATLPHRSMHDTGVVLQKKWTRDDHVSLLEEDNVSNLPVLASKHELATTSPVANIFVDEAMASKAGGGIVEKLNWVTDPEIKRKVSSLIESRLNGVRSDDQFLAYAMTPIHRGGIGFSPEQAEKTLALIRDNSSAKESKPASVRPPVDVLVRPAKQFDVNQLKPISSPSYVNVRQPIQDISPPVGKISVGPTEEFSTFSVTDFYRLAPTAMAATMKLKEKFEVFRQDSVVVFLDIRDAWYRSPLYGEYIQVLVSALANRKKISDILAVHNNSKKDAFTMEVFLAVLDINQHLGV